MNQWRDVDDDAWEDQKLMNDDGSFHIILTATCVCHIGEDPF